MTKYAWVKPLKDKRPKTVPHGVIEQNLNKNKKSYGLIKKNNITIVLCKNGR